MKPWSRLAVALVVGIASGTLLPIVGQAQQGSTLGTLGTGVPGEIGPGEARWQRPTGPTPRQPNGKPDFNGVWEHAYVPDMAQSNAAQPSMQKGAGPLPYTAAGLENIKQYDPERDGDYTGMCMPFGLMRSMNAPYPIQMMQNDRYVAFLFEQNTWFHVVPFRDQHRDDGNPTWFGDSIAKWDGDTLIVDTVDFNGFTRLDTRGNPHSEKLHLVQTFRRTNAGQIAYTVTIDDPVYYAKPWTNERILLLSNGDLIEYSCEENNRSLWEGRIKIWTPPGSSRPRVSGN
jgi:hypothetical protein